MWYASFNTIVKVQMVLLMSLHTLFMSLYQKLWSIIRFSPIFEQIFIILDDANFIERF